MVNFLPPVLVPGPAAADHFPCVGTTPCHHRDPVSWTILPESCDYMRINRDQSSTKS